MGKASRVKQRRKTPQIPGIPNPPYADTFTKAEWDAVLDRSDKLMRYFRDAVKITDGTVLGIDDGTLQLLVIHAALAGVTQDDKLALIRPKVLPDESGRLVDAVDWVPKRFDTEKARRDDAEEEARRRKAAMDVQLAQMTPGARTAFDQMFAPAAKQAFTAGASAEQRRLDNADEETKEARELRAQAERLRAEGKL